MGKGNSNGLNLPVEAAIGGGYFRAGNDGQIDFYVYR